MTGITFMSRVIQYLSSKIKSKNVFIFLRCTILHTTSFYLYCTMPINVEMYFENETPTNIETYFGNETPTNIEMYFGMKSQSSIETYFGNKNLHTSRKEFHEHTNFKSTGIFSNVNTSCFTKLYD